jgi:TRAP-type mannitol/chloroaromatic compound transport system permease large subunit
VESHADWSGGLSVVGGVRGSLALAGVISSELSHVLFDIPLSKLYRGILPFIAIYLLALALITSVPEIILVPLRLWK